MAINTRAKSKNNLNGGNVGSELNNIAIKLYRNKISKFAMAFVAVFSTALVVAFMTLPMITDGLTSNLIAKHYRLTYITGDTPREFFVIDSDGSPIQLVKKINGKPVLVMTRFDALEVVDKEIKKSWISPILLNWYLIWSIFGIAVSVYVVFKLNEYFNKKGDATLDDEFIRGGQLITKDEYLKSIAEEGNQISEITIADIPFPKKGDERLGILIYGNAGSGKSNIQFDLMAQVFKSKRKSIVYSRTGEEFESSFRPGIDVLFAPAYQGSVKWNLFADIRLKTDGAKMALAFIKYKKDEDFFHTAARTVFDKTLMSLYAKGETDTSAIAETIYTFTDESIEDLLMGTSAFNVLGSGKQRSGVLGSLNIHLEALSYLSKGDFSLREWMRKDNDSRLFLIGKPEIEEAFMSFNRIALEILLSEIAAMDVKHSDGKYWIFLDELPTLGLGPKNCILTAMNEMRKYGVCVVGGIQSDRQLFEDAGQDSAMNWLNAFQNTMVLRLTDKDTRESVVARLGSADLIQKSANANLAVNTDRDGAGTASQITPDVPIVSISEMLLLKDNTGYLKFVANNPIKIDIRKWSESGRMNRQHNNVVKLNDNMILSLNKIILKPKAIENQVAQSTSNESDFNLDDLPIMLNHVENEDLVLTGDREGDLPILIKNSEKPTNEEKDDFWD